MTSQKSMKVGSRAQVWHGSAIMTAGGLKKRDLVKDKYGRIRSKRARAAAKKNRNLGKHQITKGSKTFLLGGAKKFKCDKYKCNKCDKYKCDTKSQIKSHVIKCDRNRCNKCNKKCNSKKDYKEHVSKCDK